MLYSMVLSGIHGAWIADHAYEHKLLEQRIDWFDPYRACLAADPGDYNATI